MKRKAAVPSAVHFVRHGEVHNPKRLFYGRLPGFHLSAAGFEEAAALAARLREACDAVACAVPGGLSATSVVLHSPLLRARETAEVAMANSGLWQGSARLPALQVEPRLLEVNLPMQGRPMAELLAVGFDKVYEHGQQEEGFEDFEQVFSRVRALVQELLAGEATAGRHVVCVCHGDLCLAARLWSRHGTAAMERGGVERGSVPYPGHCSITTLLATPEGGVRWVQAAAEEDRGVAAAKRQKAGETAAR